MFGIGLPELILILALALIVVGPDKLPDLARTVAKGLLELKKTANTLKDNLTEEGNPLDDIKPELEKASKALTSEVLGVTGGTWSDRDMEKIYKRPEGGAPASESIIDVQTDRPSEDSEDETLQDTSPTTTRTSTGTNTPGPIDSQAQQSNDQGKDSEA